VKDFFFIVKYSMFLSSNMGSAMHHIINTLELEKKIIKKRYGMSF